MQNEVLVRKFMCTQRLHRRALEKQLQAVGLYRAQHQILMHLARNPLISQVELATALEVTTATVAVSVKKLEKEGYLTRKVDSADNRFYQVELTEKGKQIVEKSEKIFAQVENQMLEGFCEEEKETLMGFLLRLCENLREPSPGSEQEKEEQE